MSTCMDFAKIEKPVSNEEFDREMNTEFNDETEELISLTEMANDHENCACGCGEDECCSNCSTHVVGASMDQIQEVNFSKSNMGEHANQGFTRDDSQTATRLLEKNWSPLIVRKYQMEGWPMFISLICDANLNDLDQVVHQAMGYARSSGFVDGSIQGVRNVCGYLSDCIVKHYNGIKQGCVEGVAVLWYVDKCFCSSLYGDFMVHASCKNELFQIINTLPHI